MKINCEACQAKYTIADEKVAGKIVKIKCKKCGTTIVVNGNELGAAAQQPAYAAPAAAPAGGEEGATQVFGEQGGGADEWTVNVTDDDQRTMTAAQVAAEYGAGVINDDTYVWRDGMADWLPLGEVGELLAAIRGGGGHVESLSATRAMPNPAPVAAAGLGGTVVMEERALAPSPLAARAAVSPSAAARRPRAGVDLFGAAAAAPEPAAGPAVDPAGADRLVGERNENSVLFSLSALTAAENAVRAQSKNDEAVLDMKSSGGPPPPRNKNGRAGFDDIMNLGGAGFGGSMGGPMLAPPPLLAPVIEPPPPPKSQPAPAMVSAAPMAALMAPPKKSSPVGLIVGVVLGLAVVAGVAVFALRGSPPPPPTTTDQSQATKAVETATPPPVPSAMPSETAAADTTAPAPSGAPSAVAAAATNTGKPGAPAPGAPSGKPSAAPTSEPKAETKPETKPAETAAPATGGDGAREFNRGAATSALGAAAGAAKGCKKPDGPTGSGKVKVTFAPSGNVTSASVQGPPFAGTAVGGCVASAFRSAKVPPFDGSPVSVTKSFSIN